MRKPTATTPWGSGTEEEHMAFKRTYRWIKRRDKKQRDLPACYRVKANSTIIQDLVDIESTGVYDC